MTIKDDLAALCALEAKFKAMANERDLLRRNVLEHALSVYDTDGAAPTWRNELATVSLIVPTPRAAVFDEDAFEQYVSDAYGDDAFETLRRVRPELRDALLIKVTAPDEDAGIAMVASAPSLRILVSKDAKAAVAAELEKETAA